MNRLIVEVLRGSEDPFRFDVDGDFSWGPYEVLHGPGGAPAPIQEVRGVWTVVGAMQRTRDGSPVDGWAQYAAALSALTTPGAGQPTGVKLYTIEPDGTEVACLTIGAPDWEDIRLVELGGEPDVENPAAEFQTTWPFRLRFTASRVHESDTMSGVVQAFQKVTIEHQAGLRTITWESEFRTAEGTDARDVARELGVIPASTLGSRWSYLTQDSNGEGVDIEVLDALECDTPARTPTRVRAVCRAQEWGVSVGGGEPGTAPSEVTLEEEEEDTPEGTMRTVRASARGPNAQTWVNRWAPVDAQETFTTTDRAGNGYSKVWVRRVTATRSTLTVEAEVSQLGGQALRWEPVSRGLPPVLAYGPRLPWVLNVTVTLVKYGGNGSREDMPFPPILPAPWVLDRGRSVERDPVEEEVGRTPAQTKWSRTARLVYGSASAPTDAPAKWLRDNRDKSVLTYGVA